MNQQTFEVLCADARKAIGEHRLLDAIRSAEGMAAYAGVPRLTEALTETREAYKMLLHYMEQGLEDPDRLRLFGQFLRNTSECVDGLWREFVLRETDAPVAVAWRALQKLEAPAWRETARHLEENAQAALLARSETGSPHREKELKRLGEEHGTLFRRLFDSVWSSPAWHAEEQRAAEAFLASPTLEAFDKSVFLSAVGMGALTFFDARKLSFLLSASVGGPVALRVRAQVGAVLAYVRHADRVPMYPELEAQVRLLADEPANRTAWLELQMQLILSLETKEIERNLREEIFPAVMKKAKDLSARRPEEFEEMLGKAMEAELNPEWNKDSETLSIEKKMRRLTEMQQNGADVFMASFRMLKQKFPFFSKPVNWFCPFTTAHPDLPPVSAAKGFLRLFLGAGHLCHSDKYSFYLMLAELPGAQLENMQGQMGAALEASGLSPDAIPEPGESEAVERRLYLQDLYRYFQLFGRHSAKSDPFKLNLMLTDYSPFSEALSDADSLRQLGDFTFKERNYGQALAFYEKLPAEALTADVWQKTGFCHQLAGRYGQAVSAYERANLLKPGSAWTLKQLAACYRHEKRYDEARRCYEELELMEPEDIRNLLLLGESYARAGCKEEAFGKFFKADYLAPDSQEAKRALAWYSLEALEPEQAERYYAKLLAGNPSAGDWLNAGHAAWVSGRVAEALERYRASLRAAGKEFAGPDFLFADADLLEKYGKSADQLRLMTDLLNR